jgi:hypothetical protein
VITPTVNHANTTVALLEAAVDEILERLFGLGRAKPVEIEVGLHRKPPLPV